MSGILLYTVISLSVIGIAAAMLLYFAAQKFKVFEDPRIDLVEEALPGVNCGGCGFPGCRVFSEAMVKADDISTFFCPVGGNDVMAKVSEILDKDTVVKYPMLAVVRCSGSYKHRLRTNIYDGAESCIVASNLYAGETSCPFGCLGLGDCVVACEFNAMYMDTNKGLPVVIDDSCVECGACIDACPRHIIELRRKNIKNRKIFVSCVNQEKGGIARKNCKVACIGCGKCVKVCPHDAITLENNLAYIYFEKCKLCRKCVPECPTTAINEINFPLRKDIIETEKQEISVS